MLELDDGSVIWSADYYPAECPGCLFCRVGNQHSSWLNPDRAMEPQCRCRLVHRITDVRWLDQEEIQKDEWWYTHPLIPALQFDDGSIIWSATDEEESNIGGQFFGRVGKRHFPFCYCYLRSPHRSSTR